MPPGNEQPNSSDETRILKPGDVKRAPKESQKLGHFELRKPLGEGGMGMVYLARDLSLDRDVAVKVIRTELAMDEVFVGRFMREAKNSAALNHPNIVSTYYVGNHDGIPYLVLEYIEGKTLRQLLQTPPPMPLDKVLDIIMQCCDGLEVAARRQIVHRDIKPANIMIRKDGLVKLMDFGLSREMDGDKLTMTSNVLGTPDFMAPEQAQGVKVDFRCDLYALGITLFQCVCGYLPFRSNHMYETIRKHAEDALPHDERLADVADGRLLALIERLTAKQPEDRPSSHKEVRQELSAIRDHLIKTGVTALPAGNAGAGQLDWQRQTPASASEPPDKRTPASQANTMKKRKSGEKMPAAGSSKKSATAKALMIGSIVLVTLALGGFWLSGGFNELLYGKPVPPLNKPAPLSDNIKEKPDSPTSNEIFKSTPSEVNRFGVESGPFTITTAPGSMILMSDLLRALGTFGLNHLVIDQESVSQTRGLASFYERQPKEVLAVAALANGWLLEESSGLVRIRPGITPLADRLTASRSAMRTEMLPVISINTHSDTRFTLRLLLDALRTEFGIDYLVIGSTIPNAAVPGLSLNRQPISVLMDAMESTGLKFTWSWEKGTLVILGE